MSDQLPKVLRPHERRAQQARLETSDEDPFGHVIPPSLDVLEACEKAFPMDLSSITQTSLEGVHGQVQRMRGQQDVIHFLRQLYEQATKQGA